VISLSSILPVLFPLLILVLIIWFVTSAVHRKAYLQAFVIFCVPVLLGVLLLPCFFAGRAQAQVAACESNMRMISSALEEYRSHNNNVYPESLNQLVPVYLKELPRCPTSNQIYAYEIVKNQKSEISGFVVKCPRPDRHIRGEIRALYYSSENGLQIVR